MRGVDLWFARRWSGACEALACGMRVVGLRYAMRWPAACEALACGMQGVCLWHARYWHVTCEALICDRRCVNLWHANVGLWQARRMPVASEAITCGMGGVDLWHVMGGVGMWRAKLWPLAWEALACCMGGKCCIFYYFKTQENAYCHATVICVLVLSKMKVTTPEISWHERDPIYSVDIQPGSRSVRRLVSGGVDKFVRIWQIKEDIDGKACVDFLANLKRHTKAVNVCRFSPDGEVLATAGDDSVIIFWKLSETEAPSVNIFQEDEEDNKENWCMLKILRGHLEDIYDVSWSADGKFMISGSVDNSAILWDLTKDQKICLINEHNSFVQGVAWDPRNEFVATLSPDRSCRVYNIATRNCVHNIKKMSLPASHTVKPSSENDEENKESKPKTFRMFHDDTMRSFFRRLTFSPDGELLIIPAGLVETDPVTNATFVFTRACLNKPALYLPSPDKVTIAVRCCPQKFQLRKIPKNLHIEQDQENNNMKEWEKYSTLFCLPYRMVFAVATEDSIQLYDTQQPQPFGYVTNIHYHQLSDLAWSSNGCTLVASSTDGYCTLNIAMDTETTSDSLNLHLENSTDSNNSGEKTGTKHPSPPKPAPVPMMMKVKSADGKPRNIQITTLSSVPSSSGDAASEPQIKVRSADGKPKNVQFTTLATFTSPKNKQPMSPSSATSKILKEKTRNNSGSECVVIEDSNSPIKLSTLESTPKSASISNKTGVTPKSGDTPKSTPKRVQLTTIKLFDSSPVAKPSTSEQS
ncbi:CAF1B-like protein [Mya arenaria]|uniref:CAF1B-like protein n=1 Tax=Mya arenaria TaxID=6604 RepID=A0ABY7EJK3_MYAAR|nr:CAF1B-like protein [Mya arenaria]